MSEVETKTENRTVRVRTTFARVMLLLKLMNGKRRCKAFLAGQTEDGWIHWFPFPGDAYPVLRTHDLTCDNDRIHFTITTNKLTSLPENIVEPFWIDIFPLDMLQLPDDYIPEPLSPGDSGDQKPDYRMLMRMFQRTESELHTAMTRGHL